MVTNKELQLDPGCVGLRGSPTVVKEMKTVPDPVKNPVRPNIDEMDKIVRVLIEKGVVK